MAEEIKNDDYQINGQNQNVTTKNQNDYLFRVADKLVEMRRIRSKITYAGEIEMVIQEVLNFLKAQKTTPAFKFMKKLAEMLRKTENADRFERFGYEIVDTYKCFKQV